MAIVAGQCPECESPEVVRYGRQANGEQRYRCNNVECTRRIFLGQYHNSRRLSAVKRQIVDMALNGSGIRDTARVLGVSPTTVMTTLKKAKALHQVNPALVSDNEGRTLAVVIRKVKAVELDERWSFVGSKKHPRWLWGALDHQTGRMLAYVFGRREGQALLQLKALLAPFGIRRYYTDGWGAYHRHVAPD